MGNRKTSLLIRDMLQALVNKLDDTATVYDMGVYLLDSTQEADDAVKLF